MQRLRMFAANVLNLAGLCLIGAFVLTAQRGNSPMYTAALVGDSDDADCACALIANNKSRESFNSDWRVPGLVVSIL